MTEITLEVRDKDAERLKELQNKEPTTIDQIENEVIGMITRSWAQLPADES